MADALQNARAAEAERNLPLAVAHYTAALVKTWSSRAICRLMMGDVEGGIADLTQAIALDPHDGSLYFNRALAWEDAGNEAAMRADLERVVALDPRPAMEAWQRGDFARVRELDPGCVEAHSRER